MPRKNKSDTSAPTELNDATLDRANVAGGRGVGNPTTATDDVIVDGNIITGESLKPVGNPKTLTSRIKKDQVTP